MKEVDSLELPELEGSEKQIDWAINIRRNMLIELTKGKIALEDNYYIPTNKKNTVIDVSIVSNALKEIISSKEWIEEMNGKNSLFDFLWEANKFKRRMGHYISIAINYANGYDVD